jgi:hypothetical protein
MSRGLLPHLTAAILAMHTVLGCCWHHAHACGADCRPTSSVESPATHANHDADQCGEEDSGASESHGQHKCVKGACVFLRLLEDDVAGALHHDLPSIFCAQSNAIPPRGDSAPTPYFAAGALLPPLRLHLAHQVLLL